MTEAAFQKQVIKWARQLGWLVFHCATDSSRGRSVRGGGCGQGFPDLVLAHPQRGVIFAELKTPCGRVSAAQKKWLGVLARADAHIAVWRPAHAGDIKRTLAGEA